MSARLGIERCDIIVFALVGLFGRGVRWVAAVLPGGSACSFSADLVPGSGKAVPAVRVTLGTTPVPGNLYGDFFTSHPELVGDLFLRVSSDCGWALTIIRTEPVVI